MSDSDNDVGNVDNQPAPEPGSKAEADAPRRPPLRGWAARGGGESTTESVITRVRHSLASMFTPNVSTPPQQDQEFASLDEALPVAGIAPEFADTLPPELGVPVPVIDLESLPHAPTGDIEAIDPRTEPVLEAPTAPLRLAALQRLVGRVRAWFASRRAQEQPAAESAAATVVGGNPVFLYSKFRAFYNEIIRFKHQKTEFSAGFATALMSDASAGGSDPAGAAAALSKKLLELLELQAAEAKWMGGEMMTRYPDAQYAMAALADETFTHLEWDGQSVWPEHLLEMQLYRTHGAAYELFARIDRLLKDAPNTPVSRDLARVYMLVLAAGFQGKYRPFKLPRAIAEYRRRLYEYIYRDDPMLLYSPDRPIIPEVASRTVEGQAVSRFSSAQRWAAILALVAIGYTVIAHVTWNRLSADLEDVTSRIVIDSAGESR